jgi:hypothetical protein
VSERKPQHKRTPEQRARIAAGTKAAMANPEVRARISERTKLGILAASPQRRELVALSTAWSEARPGVRSRFIKEVFKATCSASAPELPDRNGAP